MRKLVLNTLGIVIVLGLYSLHSSGKNLRYEKSKKIAKSYEVSKQVKLAIKNSYGRVHINTWDKSEIKVDVEIIATMNNERKIQEVLDRIEIDVSESSSLISFETRLGTLKNKDKEKFEINYQVSMPKSNPLTLKNSFGSTYIGELSGNTEIDISYGELRITRLTGSSDINISFSNGTIQSVDIGEVDIKYSDIKIGTLGIVRMNQGFSDLEIESINTLDLTSKYGDISIGAIQGIKGYVGYSDFSIDRLGLELDMRAAYCGNFTIDEVARDFTKIMIEGKFGDYRISFEEGASFTFENRLSFSDFSYSGLPLDFEHKVKEGFKSRYKGKLGQGNGGYVKIDTSYGDIRFR